MSQLPPNAKRVFSGVIFDVYQWDQPMFDGTTAVFERIRRQDTVEIMATTPEGKILIQRQQQPDSEEWFIDAIAGRVEKDEDPFEAAKREMLEETGFASDDWKVLTTFAPLGKMDWTIHVYTAKNSKKIAEQNLDAGERIEVQEVDFDTFIGLVESGQMKRISFPIRERCIRAVYDQACYQAFKQELFADL